MNTPRRRALVSVFRKDGVTELCRQLVSRDFEIVSTGGTARHLAEAGIAVTPVDEITGFPEILDGRVKTLHPHVHGAILFRRTVDAHVQEMRDRGLTPIDLVVVNLYPFAQTAADTGKTADDVIEMIDIGGPSMLRAAAKNHAWVTVLVDPGDYAAVLEELAHGDDTAPATRRRLAAAAFEHCAVYDAAVAAYLGRDDGEPFPRLWMPVYRRAASLRYGENPHQQASVYREPAPATGTIMAAEAIQGKQLSFNNYLDLDAAWGLAGEFDTPTAVVVKHTNPCGVASAADLTSAYVIARDADPTSAFGGIVALNRPLDAATAKEITTTFVEAVIAPSVTTEARAILAAKRNLRVLDTGGATPDPARPGQDFRRISGGVLLQNIDVDPGDKGWQVKTRRHPTDDEQTALIFAWRVARHVRSNAIVYAGRDRTLGIGAGQMSRVDSARLGVDKARSSLHGAVLASDAFFPFRDSVDNAAAAGVAAIIQPGGSIRDEEVIAAANEANMAMVFTGVRHFRH